MSKQLPDAFYRLHAQQGNSDCAVAAMAIIFRRDPAEVLIAASRLSQTVWQTGLYATEIRRVARKLKIKAHWRVVDQFDPDEDTGVLCVKFHDRVAEHCVALIDGLVIDPGYSPPVMCAYDEYARAMNASATALLQVRE